MTLIQAYFNEPVFWRGRWQPRNAIYDAVSSDCADHALNFILQQAHRASERERRRVLYADCALAVEAVLPAPSLELDATAIRWVRRGDVFMVFDPDRRSVGAWSREAPARARFEQLPAGAELIRCIEFYGLSPHGDYVKREVASSEVRA